MLTILRQVQPILVVLVATGALLVSVAPTSADFIADSSAIKHPAARHILLDNSAESKRTEEQLLESVAHVMSLDEQTVLGMVSRDNGFGSVRCPECQAFVDQFDITDPDHVACQACGMKFPNLKYPETYIHEGKNISGEPVQWKYYAKDGKGYQYFFSAVVRHQRHHFLAAQAKDMGRLYGMTGDEQYARRAAVIILALAEAFPHWSVREDHAWYGRYILTKRPWEWRTGIWACQWSEMPINCVFAYDLTYDSAVWDELANEHGKNSRRAVEDWFRAAYQMIFEYQEDRGNNFGNLHPYTIRKVVAAGRVLNDPDMVHSMVPWFDGVVKSYFGFDGMGREGTLGYHGQTQWNLDRAMRAIEGYTDPPGYVDTKLGIKLDNADMLVRFPILKKAQEISETTRFPDGSLVTMHDTTWHRHGSDTLSAATNIELNGLGHFALGYGEGLNATQVHLHFCPLTGGSHYHQDRLAMILWAAGGEVLPDIGYARNNLCYRYFATGSLSHNMSYAGWNEPRKQPKNEFQPGQLNTDSWAKSSLLAYDPGDASNKQVQLVEAESPGPQWQGIDISRRLIMLIALDEQRSYVFDLFRLRGGDWHESILRPSADEDCDEQCDIPISPRPGTLAGEAVEYGERGPAGTGYRNIIHDLRVGDGSQDATVTWKTKETGRSVRCFLMGQSGTEFILARAPLVRPAKNTPSERDKYQGPYLMRRHTKGLELTSRFAAVYEAWPEGGKPVVDRVEWLRPEPADSLCAALRIHVGDRADLIYVSADDTPRHVGDISLSGPVAVVSMQAGRTSWAYLYGAGSIEAPGLSLKGQQNLKAPLKRVLREEKNGVNAFEVAADLTAETLQNVWLRIVHGDGSAHGYRIEDIQATEGGSRVLIAGEPGFEMTPTGMKMLYPPHYEIFGPQQLEIAKPAFAQADK
jgi:hypothetical protein